MSVCVDRSSTGAQADDLIGEQEATDLSAEAIVEFPRQHAVIAIAV